MPNGQNQKDDDRRITYFAATHTRGKREMFGIRAVDRSKHIYVIGKTGMGKSTMLENMAIQDIVNGEGIAYIDPHGSTADKLLDFIPHERIKDVVYFAPFDTDHPMGFNVMEDVGYDKRHLVVSGLMGAFKRIWVDAWSARMEYFLQNTMLALLEYPGSTLLDVNKMLTNKTFRDVVVANVTDPIVKSFWTEEFAGFTDKYTAEATPAIQNKIGQFVANPLIRNIVGQPKSTFNIRELMDERKILIVNLSKGRMGETNASLLGSMLTVKIYLAAMSRADEPPARMARLPRYFFYVDEFQSMMNEAFADILSESRKYKLALTLANQYIEQMEEGVRDAVFGNVGTMICFRIGPFDAETLKTFFEPTFTAEDLIGLGIGEIYLSLMIDGVGSKPFSAQTMLPIEAPTITYRDDVLTRSRAVYGVARAEVEAVINKKQADFMMPPKTKPAGKPSYGDRPRPAPGAPTPAISPVERMREQEAATGQSAPPAPQAAAKPQPTIQAAPILQAQPALARPHSVPLAQPAAQAPDEKRPEPQQPARSQPPAQQEPRREAAFRRPEANRPSSFQKPVAPAQKEDSGKNALRDAIAAAKQNLAPKESAKELSKPADPAPEEPVRSPIDVLRARLSVQARVLDMPPVFKAATAPHKLDRAEHRQEKKESSFQRSEAGAQQSAYQKRPEQGQEGQKTEKDGPKTHAEPKSDPGDHHDGEVSSELLRKVVNGGHDT